MDNKILEKIKSEVVLHKEKAENDNSSNFLSVLSTGIGFVNLPIGLLLYTLNIIYNSLKNNEELEKPMPQEWLDKVSSIEMSQRGLDYLSTNLSKKGYISILEASKWLEIEKEEDLNKTNINKNDSKTKIILDKAKKEWIKVIDSGLLSKGLDLLEDKIPSKPGKYAIILGRKLLKI